MKLVIYRAADAFLYLPTYVAEEYGIFETLLDNTTVSFAPIVKSGDENAIFQMLEENKKEDTIAIAIGDPTAFLETKNEDEIKDIRVIGTIINKLAFWAINHSERAFASIDEFGGEFKKIIYYKDDFLTGNYLGKVVKRRSGISNKVEVDFGSEIEMLERVTQEDEKSIAITADIVSIAKGLIKEKRPLKIHYSFSKSNDCDFKEFITTGIVTTKKCCEQYGEQLCKIIEGIQKSILMLYSSEKVAELVCTKISQKQSITLQLPEIKKIITLIKEERFYPADLNINKDAWDKAVKARSRVGFWDETNESTKDIIENSFERYVDNRFVYKAERSLANQLGIDLKIFEEELKSLIDENQDLKGKQKYYSRLLYTIHFCWVAILNFFVKIKWVVVVLTAVLLFYLWYTKSELKKDMTEKDWFAIVIGIALSISLFIYGKKDNEKHNRNNG